MPVCISAGKLLTAAVGSLCVQATGSRSFQSVSPSSWSVRRKQEPVEGRWALSIRFQFQDPSPGGSQQFLVSPL